MSTPIEWLRWHDKREAPITMLNDLPWTYCAKACAYGECGGYPAPGCGGCCGCLGGCQVEWENGHSAPSVWEGDPS